MNRDDRQCFLLGNDPVTGNNYDHRKTWIEEKLQRLACCEFWHRSPSSQQQTGNATSESVEDAATKIDDTVIVTQESAREASPAVSDQFVGDRLLAPLTIDERQDPIGPDASSIGHMADAASVGSDQEIGYSFRCSDTGFLPLLVADYLVLTDWTARRLADDKPGSTPHVAPLIFARLSIAPHV